MEVTDKNRDESALNTIDEAPEIPENKPRPTPLSINPVVLEPSPDSPPNHKDAPQLNFTSPSKVGSNNMDSVEVSKNDV